MSVSRDPVTNPKKEYIAPSLVIHGSMETLTRQIVKDFGPGDGLFFNNVPISTVQVS